MAKEHLEQKGAREHILQTAALLFTQKGVHGTSLNDIADAAAMSKGTLYYHYPAKEQLVCDVLDGHIGRVTDTVFFWMGEVTRETPLKEAVSALLDALTQNAAQTLLHVVLCAEAATGNAALSESLLEAYRAWNVMLELALLRAGARDASHTLKRARMFFTVLDGYLLQANGFLTQTELEAVAEFLTE